MQCLCAACSHALLIFSSPLHGLILSSPTGLERFISTAKKLPCSDLYDVVEGYIKISMECAEIFKLLEGEKHPESEVSYKSFSWWAALTDFLIWDQWISNITLPLPRWCWFLRAWRWSFWGQRVTWPTSTWLAMLLWKRPFLATWDFCRDLCTQKTTGWSTELSTGPQDIWKRKLPSAQRPNVVLTLTYRFVRQCLSLLTALVSQGPEAAREVLSHIYINKSLSGLAKRKDKKVCFFYHFSSYFGSCWFLLISMLTFTNVHFQGKPDVRMGFIQFALSFLVSGDNAVVGQILEIKGNY